MFAKHGLVGKGIFIRMLNVRWRKSDFLWLQKALDRIRFGLLSSKETGVILFGEYQEIEGAEMHSRQVKKCTIVGTFRNHESLS